MNEDNTKRKIFSYSAHEGREDLLGEHKLGDIGQLTCLIVFLTVWITDSFIYELSTFLSTSVPFYARSIIGVPMAITAFIMARKGLKEVFQKVRDPPEVITTGAFAHSRHPIYLSEMILYLSLVVATLSLVSLIVLVPIYLFLTYIAKTEEKLMLENFGDEYKEYMEKVPRWLF
ncbi:MAG: methyltransferase family protein [Candidatus Kariarchaeaceae archaeon]